MRVIITGGAYQGKASFAREKYKDGILFGREFVKLIEDSLCEALPVLDDTDDSDRQYKNGLLAAKVLENVSETLKEYDVVIIPEMGNGLVPLDIKERRFLEVYGRVTEKLGAKAAEVIRIVCGCPVFLKE